MPVLHDMSKKSKGTVLGAVVGGPHQTSSTTVFHFCFSEEVRRHMTRASWCELLRLFKVQSTCCRLVRGGQFCWRVCTVWASHVLAGLCLSFLLTWEHTQTTHSVGITPHRWQHPPRVLGNFQMALTQVQVRIWRVNCVAWMIFLLKAAEVSLYLWLCLYFSPWHTCHCKTHRKLGV